MKDVKIRYTLRSNSKPIAERLNKEKVYAEVSAGFKKTIGSSTIYDKFKFALEVSIYPQHFGILQTKRGVINFVYDSDVINSNIKFSRHLKDRIAIFETQINLAISYFTNLKMHPCKEEFKAYLMNISGRISHTPTVTYYVLDFLTEYVQNLRVLIGSGKSTEVKENTIQSFENLRPIIERYEKHTGRRLTFETLNEIEYNSIWSVTSDIVKGNILIESYTRRPNPNGYSQNTLKVYQTKLVQLIKEAKKKGYVIPIDIISKDLIAVPKIRSKKTDTVLNENELLKVLKYTPKTKNLQLAKDYIVIASFTGMRLQSMLACSNKKLEKFDDGETQFDYIPTILEKTNTECFIPAFSSVKEIVERNSNLIPDFKSLALTNLNLNIRKVLKSLEIKNHELFSSHNFRSTFATNLELLRVPQPIVSKMTHPSKQDKTNSLYIYIKADMLNYAKIFYDSTKSLNSALYKYLKC